MSLRLGFLAAILILPLAVASHRASATAYTFSSSGSFSSCSGCNVNAAGTTIGWGGDNSINGTGRNAYDGSTMTADTLSNQTGNTPATADTIGKLTWYNASTSADNTATTVTADYKLTINFTNPLPGAVTSDVFDLTVTNTANNLRVCFFIFCSNTGDVNDTTGFSGGSNSITVDGLVLSNISFVASGASSFNMMTGVWSNPEGDTSDLFITANIAVAPASVPEPGSLAILGSALAGLGLVRRRKARLLNQQ